MEWKWRKMNASEMKGNESWWKWMKILCFGDNWKITLYDDKRCLELEGLGFFSSCVRRGLEREVLIVKQSPPVELTSKQAGEDPRRRVFRRNDSTLCHLKNTPVTQRQIQTHERIHIEPPTWLGLECITNDCSRTYASTISWALHSSTSAGASARSGRWDPRDRCCC